MPDFRYRALDANGQESAGEFRAETVQQALEQLEAQELTVLSIERVEAEPAAGSGGGPTERLLGREYVVLRDHVQRIWHRSQELVPALAVYAEELPAGRRRQLLRVVSALESENADEVIARLYELPDYWLPLLSSATRTRDAGRVLRVFLEESERAEETRRRWRVALAYPLVIVTIALTVFVALSLFVIPVFREMYESFGLELPLLTQLILDASVFIASGRVLILLAGCLVLLLGLLAIRRFLADFTRWIYETLSIQFGRSMVVARLAGFIADLLESGQSLPNSVRLAGMATSRWGVQTAATEFAQMLTAREFETYQEDRHPLSAAVVYALRTEMDSHTRIRLLREVGQCHREAVGTRLSWMRGLVEPVTVCVVGILVGMVAIAMFLPLVRLVTGLT